MGEGFPTLGSPIRAIPTDSFRFCPPLIEVASCSVWSTRSISDRIPLTLLSSSPAGIPLMPAKSCRCSAQVNFSYLAQAESVNKPVDAGRRAGCGEEPQTEAPDGSSRRRTQPEAPGLQSWRSRGCGAGYEPFGNPLWKPQLHGKGP